MQQEESPFAETRLTRIGISLRKRCLCCDEDSRDSSFVEFVVSRERMEDGTGVCDWYVGFRTS